MPEKPTKIFENRIVEEDDDDYCIHGVPMTDACGECDEEAEYQGAEPT